MMKYKRKVGKKYLQRMSKESAVCLLIIGLLMGTVFVFGTSYWNKPIEEHEAIQVEANFTSYNEIHGRRRLKEVSVRFSDHEQLYIDGLCADEKVLEELEKLPENTKVRLVVHPNSNTIMSMKVKNNEILNFENVQHHLYLEKVGFFYIGLFMYIGAACGLLRLLQLQKKKK